jgi:hypothetical protein
MSRINAVWAVEIEADEIIDFIILAWHNFRWATSHPGGTRRQD